MGEGWGWGEGWAWGEGKGWGHLHEDSEGQQLKQEAEGLVGEPGRRLVRVRVRVRVRARKAGRRLQRGRASCSVRRQVTR